MKYEAPMLVTLGSVEALTAGPCQCGECDCFTGYFSA
jgi:hypothetical protein